MRLSMLLTQPFSTRSMTGVLFATLLIFVLALPVRAAQAVLLLSTITVTTTADEFGTGAACSLREAIQAANTNTAFGGCPAGAGADIINLPGGTYQLTQPNAGGLNEDSNATGDLDIRSSLTIQGVGAGSTFIQAGTNTSNGIDKVLGVNPYCENGVNVTIDGVTIRYGYNTQAYGTADFSYTGGGLDWCGGTGTESFTLSNAVVSDNTNVNGYGGGLNIDSIDGYTGAINLTNVIFQNNKTLGTAYQVSGGGINIFGDRPNVTITGCQVLNNSTARPASGGEGGGINIRLSDGGSVQVHNSTISGNTAGYIGGGINITTYSNATVITIDQDTRITNNVSGGVAGTTSGGGGISITGVLTTTPIKLSKITVSGNSESPLATTHWGGGGIYVYGGNATVEYSRIVNNTVLSTNGGSGLFMDSLSGAVTATNNWWGCSTGPGAAPCNTAVLKGGSAGSLVSTPYLRLNTSAAAPNLVTNQSTLVTASFRNNSAGTDVSANIDRLAGLPVAWSAALGNLSGQQATIQPGGTATASYQATGAGAGMVAAVVDNDTATSPRPNVVPLTISKANTTLTITSDAPDPSQPGQAVTVQYTLAGAQGNSPTAPTGSVTVGDGVNSSSCPVSANSCAVTLNTPGSRTITASYSGDSNFNGDTDTQPHTVAIDPPSITKSFGASSILLNGSTGLDLVITNPVTNSVALSGVGVTDLFPSGLVVSSTPNASNTCGGTFAPTAGASSISLTGGTVGVNSSCTLHVDVTATSPGIKNNTTGNVTSSNGGTGNTASASLTVAAPDLSVTMTDAPDPVTAGENLTYTLNLANTGTAAAQTVTLTDAVPANTTFVSAQVTSGTGWSLTTPAVGSTGNVVFSKGSVDASETAVFQIVVRVSSGAAQGAAITNTAAAATATTESDTSDNTAATTTTVQARADLSVAMTDTPDPVVAGGNIVYTITLSSSGPSNAQVVTLTGTLPASTTFVSAQTSSGTGWSITTPAVGGTGNVVFSKTTLAPGEPAAFQVTVKVVSSTAAGAAINFTTTAASTTNDPSSVNNTASATTTVQSLVLVSPLTLTVAEPSGTATFNISLASQPTAAVTFPLSSSDLSECSVPTSVTIQPDAWQAGVNVPVRAIYDGLVDGSQTCLVGLQTTVSTDNLYNGMDPEDVAVTVLDRYTLFLPSIAKTFP